MAKYISIHTGNKIDEAVGKVDGIESDVSALSQEITTLEGTVSQLDQDVTTLEGTIDTINSELTDIYEDLSNLNSGISTHTSDETIHNTIAEIETALANTFEPKKGSDDNYVTDAEKTLIGNTSGTNTGDETASTIKTKLGITTLSGDNTGDQDLSGLQLKNNMVANTILLTGDWVSDTTYSGYGYKAVITISGVTSSMLAEVTFGHTESISGNYSPVCLTGTNSVTIYSKVNTGITIPTILIQK